MQMIAGATHTYVRDVGGGKLSCVMRDCPFQTLIQTLFFLPLFLAFLSFVAVGFPGLEIEVNGLFNTRSAGVFGPAGIGLEGARELARVFSSWVFLLPTVNEPFFDGEGESFSNCAQEVELWCRLKILGPLERASAVILKMDPGLVIMDPAACSD